MESPLNHSLDGYIQSFSRPVLVGDKLIDHQYYIRFIAKETELWMFGVGLGDQAVMQQLGDSFLEVCQQSDPQLGRIMLSVGSTATAFFPYKGDVNLWWAWGDCPEWLEKYLSKTWVKPDLCLCASKKVQSEAKKAGFPATYCPLGVNDRFFKPLNQPRKGLGYSGADSKSPEQKQLILNPFLKRADFEWKARMLNDEYLSLPKLNEWYNSKQILFGMINEMSIDLNIMPNRVFETFASGTPLLFPKHNGFSETFGYEQPYPICKVGDVENAVEEILNNYGEVQKKFAEYGELMRVNHNYKRRLQTIFEAIKELKK